MIFRLENEACKLKMDNLFISFAGVDHNIEKYELDLKIYNCRI